MAVTQCYEIASGRQGGFSTNQRGSIAVREYTLRFFVQTDSPYDGIIDILTAGALPRLGATYQAAGGEFDLDAVVVDYDPRQLDNTRTCWHVDVRYTTDWERTDQPLLDPPQIDFSTENYQEDVIGEANPSFNPLDPNSEPFIGTLVNKVGDPIDGVTRDASRRVITVTRNELSFNDANVAYLLDTVNNSSWNNYAANTVLCRSIDAIGQWHKNVVGQPDYYYYQVKYVFVVQWRTWIGKYLHRGPRYWFASEPKPKQFLRDDGTPYIGLLDANGRRLVAMTATPDDIAAAVPTYLSKYIYRKQDFSVFNINLGLPLKNQKLRRAS